MSHCRSVRACVCVEGGERKGVWLLLGELFVRAFKFVELFSVFESLGLMLF